ncbi:hypothetical protein BKA70DRAFT_1310450 [Coprinopsis sp. MPI-PUGE-AT-0042]|nr:hypothetical protein BKA70DRAFT_1310450 [Coprinopsis sp. MPI-PUGE-AT-0042]
MDSPHQLSPYLSANIPLPHYLTPTLDVHLTQLSVSITELDAEIDQLERALDAKKQKRDHYKKLYRNHASLKAPIRKLPLEILGMIFSFILGDEPFERLEYCTYGYIRRVCTTWRDVLASTPDICRGLEVLLDRPPGQAASNHGDGVWGFDENLAPWLAIVSRNYPYHLVLGAADGATFDDAEDGVPDLAEWILSTPPTPTILTIDNSDVFSLVYACGSRENKISRLLLSFYEQVDRADLQEVPLEDIFPCLLILVIDAPTGFSTPMAHINLQALTLTGAWGAAQTFAEWLMEMPRLQELKIGYQDLYSRYCPATRSPLIHSTIEILVVEGEDVMMLMEYLTFPSLKFLALDAWGLFDDSDEEALKEIIPAFLQRSCPGKHGFTASFKGKPSKVTFELFIQNLPLHTRLHYALDGLKIDHEDDAGDRYRHVPCSLIPRHAHHVTEVFFSKTSNHLSWLQGSEPFTGGRLIDLYLPTGILQEEEIEIRREELRGWGYALVIVQADAFTKLLRPSIPPMTIEWNFKAHTDS